MDFLTNSRLEASTKDNSTDTGNKTAELDKFHGQPHYEGESFNDREFEPDFLEIFMHEPFLGGISLEMDKIPDPNCSTAYVGVNKHTHNLIMGYNPYFFRSMKSDKRQGVIVHELYHVVLQHLFERNVEDRKYAMAWNIGTDMAINSMIGAERLPEIVIIPGKAPLKCKDKKLSDFIRNSKPMLHSEFYFEGIKKILDEREDDDIGIGSLDDHSGWGDIPEDVQDQIKDKVRGMIERAVNRADMKNSWGTVPSEVQEQIRKLLRNEVDWRAVMKQFFGNARTITRKSTMKRLSKKAPYQLPGCKRGTIARFAFFIDQSGSMSDEDVALCFAEVESACKETNIDVYNFDVTVDENSHKIWKKGHQFPWSRTRSGGTNFNGVQEFVNSQKNRGKWSGIVILTDGYADTMGAIVGAKVLWILTPTGTAAVKRQGDLIVQLKKDAKNKQIAS